jgi:hypothetical protein
MKRQHYLCASQEGRLGEELLLQSFLGPAVHRVVSSVFFTLREIFIGCYKVFNHTIKDQSNPDLPPKRRY